MTTRTGRRPVVTVKLHAEPVRRDSAFGPVMAGLVTPRPRLTLIPGGNQ